MKTIGAGVSIVAVMCLAVSANAAWTTITVPNGDLNTPGSGGSSYIWQGPDGYQVYTDWQIANRLNQANASGYNGWGERYIDTPERGGGYYFRMYGYNSHSSWGPQRQCYFSSDELPGVSIEAKRYRLTFEYQGVGNNHDATAAILFGPSTASYDELHSGNYVFETTMPHDVPVAPVTWQTATLIWDNSNDNTAPTEAYDAFVVTDSLHLNEDLRIGFSRTAGSDPSGDGGWMLDNITFEVFETGDPVPEPATMSLLALGGLGVLVRRRRR